MKLNDLRDNPGARTPRTRVGRGIGSGKGKTAGRGQKGQKSRSGVAVKGFEGGQMPLHMRVPKRGFNNNFAKDFAQTNVGAVQAAIDSGKIARGALIDHAMLVAAGIARKSRDGVRILGEGRVSTQLRFKVAHVTRGAREAIEGAGGSIEIIAVIPASEKAAAKKYSANPRDSERRRRGPREGNFEKDDVAKRTPTTSLNRKEPGQRLASVGDLMSLRQELALGAAGRSEDVLGVIAQVYATLKAANGVGSMEEHPDYDDDRAIMLNALLADLHQQLMSRDKRAARAAAVAMVAICAPTEAGLSTLPLEGTIARERAALAASHLSRILFDAGDRSYTTFEIERRRSVPAGIEYEGLYLVSRVLPVSLDSAVVVLPLDREIPAHADEIRVFVDGSRGDPDIAPADTGLTGQDVVIARRVRFTVSKARAKKPVLISFEVPHIVTETRKLLAQDLALTA